MAMCVCAYKTTRLNEKLIARKRSLCRQNNHSIGTTLTNRKFHSKTINTGLVATKNCAAGCATSLISAIRITQNLFLWSSGLTEPSNIYCTSIFTLFAIIATRLFALKTSKVLKSHPHFRLRVKKSSKAFYTGSGSYSGKNLINFDK